MAKADHPALFQPGLHKITQAELYQAAVAVFPADSPRHALYAGFAAWSTRLQALGLRGTVWIDGSFLTEKQDPADIDLVLWSPLPSRPLDAVEQTNVGWLLNHQMARLSYRLDLYVEMPATTDVIHRQAYWRGFFGYCHDLVTAKGLVEVSL